MSERRRLFRDEAFARRGRTEPIDGLLRITAPHEWVFLGLLGLALLGALVWAVFGTVERGLSASCEIATDDANQIEVVAEVSAQDARRVQEGMSARVAVIGAGESWDALVRDVQDVRDVTSGEPSLSDEATHRVWLAGILTPETIGPGQVCSVRIVLSREAPIRLIAAVGLE